MIGDAKNLVMSQLNDIYDIVYVNTLEYFFSHPINILYRQLLAFQAIGFQTNQRIVIIDNLPDAEFKKHFYIYLQKIVHYLDITNCFVLVVSADTTTDQYLAQAKVHTNDATDIQVYHTPLPLVWVENPTNYNIPDTVCVLPWINLEITAQGQVKPCCLFALDTEHKVITEFPLETIINDSKQSGLRKDFLLGHRPKSCAACWKDEDNFKDSKRMRDQYVYRQQWFDVDFNNVHDANLSSLDIKLKNTCNLSCRICNPLLSSKWQSEVNQNPESYPQWSQIKIQKQHATDSTYASLWTSIEKIGNNLQYITFSGGEPLLDKSHSKMLQYFIDKGLSAQISLHYNTNGTVYAGNLIELWQQFKSVELSFSIDNTGTKFEYERYGSTWLDVVENMSRYKQLSTDIICNVYATVSALNILDGYELYKFCKHLRLPLIFNALSLPEELNIRNFTNAQKFHITKHIQAIDDTEFLLLFEPILNIMNSQRPALKITEMINYLTVTDNIRNQNFTNIYPELVNVLHRE